MTPKSVLILSVFAFVFTAASAQIDDPFSNEIKKLRAVGIDTFVSVSVPHYGVSPSH
jgi:hypothetical protein